MRNSLKSRLWNIPLALLLIFCLFLAIRVALMPKKSPEESNSQLLFTEICPKNDSILEDNDGKSRDYVEVYNPGQTLDLTGYRFTDGKRTSPSLDGIILESGAYRVFFLAKDTTGFSIGASGGDSIQLLDPNGNVAAQASIASVASDQVMLYDSGEYILSYDATPGFPNDAAGLEAFLYGHENEDPRLVVSEVLISNKSSFPGIHGEFPDVIELYNTTGDTLYLGNYFLSDDLSVRFNWRLPDWTLESGDRLLILCDSKNGIDESGMIHANFSLSHGETLVLTDHTSAYTANRLELPADDTSLLRQTDGSFLPGSVSLGYANDPDGILTFAESRIHPESALVISEVLLSSAGIPVNGVFCDIVEIQNRSSVPVSTADWYLTDDTDPYAWALPAQTLQPGEYLLVACSPQTTGFSLSSGETLRLMGPDYLFAPPVTCVSDDLGHSLSIQSNNAYGFTAPSLGYENTTAGGSSFLSGQMTDDLQFSELMSANTKYLKGPYGDTCDWLELYNASDRPIQLADYSISDTKNTLGKYPLPERILEPGEYCVILLKEDMTNLRSGYPALPMNLSTDGEALYLAKNGQVIDYVFLPELSADISYGRSGSASFTTLSDVTPGKENGPGVQVAAMPTANLPQGAYDGVDYLDIELSGDGTIYYTTNCYAPSQKMQKYTGPIRLTETTVIRAICIPEDGVASQILDLTYLINEYDNLATLSLVTSPKYLWSDTSGIYVLGNNAEEEEPYLGANYWMDWEIPASISLFETDGNGFSVNCGVQIFGGFTRTLDKKSLALYFRDIYGDGSLNYPLFGEESLDQYESVVLRTAGQDAFTARMRDVVITSLMGDHTDVPVQNYKPVVVYLNGEYWGLHYIREKINENYIAAHYNMDAEDVHLTKLGGWSDKTYIALRDYVLKNDMSDPECYAYVCSQMDIDNYIDFFAAEMWIANTDNGNVKYFISPEGKWTWIFYDTDISFGDAEEDRVSHNLSNKALGKQDVTCKTFAVCLMDNPDFRDRFLTRLAWQMNNLWTEENIIARIDEIESLIIGDMEKECDRWNTRYSSWQKNVEHLRQFARERNTYMLQHIQEYFELTDRQMRQYGFEI